MLDRLREMPDESVHCCITSPPYYGLRDYGTAEWDGGDQACDHLAPVPGGTAASTLGDYDNGLAADIIEQKVRQRQQQYRHACRKCGATRVDQQIGLEDSPEHYVAKLVEVFAEVRRVLRADGTLWLNLGDSYARAGGPRKGKFGRSAKGIDIPDGNRDSRGRIAGVKDKDVLGIPWMVAFALRADGWYLRSEIIWAKPNPMPESVTDRPTKAHEQVFLLVKSPRYYYDAEAVREADKGTDHARAVHDEPSLEPTNGLMSPHSGLRRAGMGRNRRSVWEIATKPCPEAHFATFPPKLVEPMVLAGTAGQTCGVCGAPWQRILERREYGDWNPRGSADADLVARMSAGLGGSSFGEYEPPKTVGWESTCDHADGGGHSVVLDPFAGTGTTLQVAVERGRDAIGIELNPDSVMLVEKRMAVVTAPLFAEAPA